MSKRVVRTNADAIAAQIADWVCTQPVIDRDDFVVRLTACLRTIELETYADAYETAATIAAQANTSVIDILDALEQLARPKPTQ
jgi:hypothetical protein